MRWVSGMAHRSEFKWAVELCDGIMTCFYILLVRWGPEHAVVRSDERTIDACTVGHLLFFWRSQRHHPALLVTCAQACTAYHKLGDSFDASLPITSVLPRDGWTRFINLLLLVRCLVACELGAAWQAGCLL